MQVEESLFVEKFVDCKSKSRTHAQDGSECIGARTQVCDLAEEFKCVTFLLQRIFLGVGCTVNLQGIGLYFAGLSFAH